MSIFDAPHYTLNPEIWDDTKNVKPEVKRYLHDLLTKIYPANKVFHMDMIGSNVGYQYSDTSDIDINIGSIPGETFAEWHRIFKMFNETPNLLPGTQHQINFFFQEYRNKPVDWENSLGAYNLLTSTWMKKPIPPDVLVDLAERRKSVINYAKMFVLMLKTEVQDLVNAIHHNDQRLLRVKVTSLHKVLRKIDEDRKTSYAIGAGSKSLQEPNIVYKFIEHDTLLHILFKKFIETPDDAFYVLEKDAKVNLMKMLPPKAQKVAKELGIKLRILGEGNHYEASSNTVNLKYNEKNPVMALLHEIGHGEDASFLTKVRHIIQKFKKDGLIAPEAFAAEQHANRNALKYLDDPKEIKDYKRLSKLHYNTYRTQHVLNEGNMYGHNEASVGYSNLHNIMKDVFADKYKIDIHSDEGHTLFNKAIKGFKLKNTDTGPRLVNGVLKQPREFIDAVPGYNKMLRHMSTKNRSIFSEQPWGGKEAEERLPNYFVYAPISDKAREQLPQIDLPTHNYHITLKYLGGLPPEKVEAIKNSLQEFTKKQRDMTVKVKDYGTFPGNAIYHASTNIPKRLDTLKKGLDVLLGPDLIQRPYHPHVTLTYNKQEEYPAPTVDDFQLKRVILSKATGRYEPYTPVAKYDLLKRNIFQRIYDWATN